MKKTNINYLYNSGFVIQMDKAVLIFDYFKDESNNEIRSIKNGVITEEILKTDKPVYVFVSHSHPDHFNHVIFSWKKINSKIEYILSSDIDIKEDYPICHIMSQGESLKLKDVYIEAYGSTDIGISFFINIDGLNVFHAGDLNWWHWYDADEKYNINMAKAFKTEIDKLENKNIDIIFFPVDSRLRENFYLGGGYVVEKLDPKVLIPMHFGDNVSITKQFAERYGEYDTKIIVINERGQEIIVD